MTKRYSINWKLKPIERMLVARQLSEKSCKATKMRSYVLEWKRDKKGGV